MPFDIKHWLIYLFILSATASFAKQSSKEKLSKHGNLTFKIVNIQNPKKGFMLILIYKKENWAPDKPEKAFKIVKVRTKSTIQEVTINDIPFGTYAIGLIHDINSNNKLDTRWFPPGMPSEDVGASNNAEGGPFGAPPWEKAKFTVDKKEVLLRTIKMAHLYK